jgi:RimJ/RimL family protein N-acetyltransferase
MHAWPLLDLQVRTPRLTLRVPDDEDLEQLGDVAAAGVHGPSAIPFERAWALESPDDIRRGLYQWQWSGRAELKPDKWRLSFGVWEGRTPLGVQDVFTENFSLRRNVETGSWLGLAHQGKGIGKEMRVAALHLVFAGLGAQRADTSAHHDNPASLGVTRALGYRPNGDELTQRAVIGADHKPTGEREAVQLLRFTLSRDDWEQRRRDDIEFVGLEPCLPLLGIGD